MRDLKIFTDNIEKEAIDQINTLLEQPAFADCKIRIMPDVHAGVGCVIGFTADLGDRVIPNIVGVDIGCGMLTVELGRIDTGINGKTDSSIANYVTDIDYEKLDNVIRTCIPSGRNVHEEINYIFPELKNLRCYNKLKNIDWLERSMGTLGGGNHFIEIDEGFEGRKYLVIHTGSRNLGKQVANYYQNLAIELMTGRDKLAYEQDRLIAEYKDRGRSSEIQDAIKELRNTWRKKTNDVPKELCYLTDKYRDDYIYDMKICQRFAKQNRLMIALKIMLSMGWYSIDLFETVHNYIDESNMIRKGAISAKKGEKVLIPINMRDGSLLCVGKGNEDWNCSAPHGAGRIMSRSKARESISMESFRESMTGIYTTSVCESTIDESPMAYKSMNEIINNIKDTVDILDVLKPVYNFKASED